MRTTDHQGADDRDCPFATGIDYRCLICQKLTGAEQAAIEALYSIFSRPNHQDDDIKDIVFPMLQPRQLQVLRELYGWASAGFADVSNIDEEKYSLCKKLSEVSYRLIGAFLLAYSNSNSFVQASERTLSRNRT